MPPTDRGGGGYSDEYVAKLVRELTLYIPCLVIDF